MRDLLAWEHFQKTGKVSDFLDYVAVHRDCVLELNRLVQRDAVRMQMQKQKDKGMGEF